MQYAQNPLEEGDLDVTVMVWNIRRRVDPSVFPARRVTVYFEFTHVPKNNSSVVDNQRSRDCRSLRDRSGTSRGGSLYATIDLRTMIAIWFGRLRGTPVCAPACQAIGPRELRGP